MNLTSSSHKCQRSLLLTALSILTVFVFAAGAAAHQANPATLGQSVLESPSHQGDTSLTHQLRKLQAKVANLEATLKQAHQGMVPSSSQNMNMDSMKMDPAMSEMKIDGTKKGKGKNMGLSGMETISGQGQFGEAKMGMKMKGAGMQMMGQMKGMGQMQMSSSLPGFPGASHIYHIGATSFFLDHAEHITLKSDQQTALNGIKEKTLLEQATFDRQIAEAEQELWVLTGTDSPDIAKLEAKVRNIERLNGNKRIAFIRAVGQATEELTHEQRMVLVGMLSADHKAAVGSDESP